jgi:copper chaperone CopZ
MTTVKYKTNIHCGNCIKSVTPTLNNLDNVDLWKVDLEHDDKILEVTLDDEDKSSVLNAVKGAGFEIEEML